MKNTTTATTTTTAPGTTLTARYCSVQDAAQMWGCSEKTVRRWISAGKITPYRYGSRFLRVDPVEIEQMLRDNAGWVVSRG